MARFKKIMFGMPIGKLNGLVFKVRKGKPYICTEPIYNSFTDSPVVHENNSKFGFFAPLTSAIQRDYFLRQIWEGTKVKGDTPRHKIQHINWHIIDSARNLDNLKLVPFENLFQPGIPETVFGEELLTLTFPPFGINYKQKTYPLISAHGILYWHSRKPEAPTGKSHFFQDVCSARIPYRNGEEHIFEIDWDPMAQSVFTSKQFCLTLILEDKVGKPSICSANVMI